MLADIARTFFRLGVTSFGGPAAHIGYFRTEFVERKRWLDAATYAQIVAVCSVLPGPTSSQVGMAVGLVRGGPLGACIAWLGFTLPSAFALALLALALHAGGAATTNPYVAGALAGVGAAAAAVVAQAVLGLATSLCTDRATQGIAIGAALLAVLLRDAALFALPIVAAAGLGAVVFRTTPSLPDDRDVRVAVPGWLVGVSLLVLIAAVAISVLPAGTPALAFVQTIVRAGTLVFGGGHVVLPLLQGLVANGLVGETDFFAGYGAAQAVPGPLFTFASYLGAIDRSRITGVLGAAAATVLIFLPSFALVFAVLPVWGRVRMLPRMGGALRGANAAVVGLLGSVLYDPLSTTVVHAPERFAFALAAFGLLVPGKVAPWLVILVAAVAGAMLLR
jgi:chromate transporter